MDVDSRALTHLSLQEALVGVHNIGGGCTKQAIHADCLTDFERALLEAGNNR